MKTKPEILAWIQEHRLFYLATVEDGQPRVRAFGCMRADEEGILFTTQTYKDVCQQMAANPAVEMCFYDAESGVQVRVSGTVERIEDERLQQEILERLPFLKPIVEERGLDVIAPHRLRHGRATVWTMASGLGPKEYIEL